MRRIGNCRCMYLHQHVIVVCKQERQVALALLLQQPWAAAQDSAPQLLHLVPLA
jgi:hypothetical protein